jgi:hypothetical protein
MRNFKWNWNISRVKVPISYVMIFEFHTYFFTCEIQDSYVKINFTSEIISYVELENFTCEILCEIQ